MARVKIKFKHNNDPRHRQLLLQTLSERNIYATRIITISDGYIVLTRTDDDVDLLLSPEMTAALQAKGFSPLTPPEQKAKRTVILTRLDEYIYRNDEDTLKDEMIDNNTWIEEGDIAEVFRFPNSPTVKVTFSNSTKAKQATEKGFLMCSMSVSPHQVKQEIYINITTCMRCYTMDDHFTNHCSKPREYKICSECSEEGHTWRDCHNTNKKCINCSGDHRTLAMRCPNRKRLITEKKKVIENTPTPTSYSAAAKMTQPSLVTNINLEKDTPSKILSCLLHAHLSNLGEPGTFEEVLQDTLKANNLPVIKIPKTPPSKKILDMAYSKPTQHTQTQQPTHTSTHQASNITQEEHDLLNQVVKHTPATKRSQSDIKISGTEIGLQLITKKSIGWPRDGQLGIQTIKERIKNNTCKWIYTDNSYNEEEIYQYLTRNLIILDNCWYTIEDSRLNKVHNGLETERTPPPNKPPNKLQRNRTLSK